ncbi:hypothetical protein NP233_g981 [Leucocoprinus birnbaumii]|uniref:DUF6570 domain-containing protein n=1 Tax=Leucocoprinus birnbaumii TaxID=56174 RepID=A0AAD5YYB2_9AGAR|nr:hypothetical protein NP233_g981 [Leucocoprinus birnbaumii]
MLPTESQKIACLSLYRKLTSTDALRKETCGVCGELSVHTNIRDVEPASVPVSLLKAPRELWTALGTFPPLPMAGSEGLSELLLEPSGVYQSQDKTVIKMCLPCLTALQNGRMPSTAIANHNFQGPIPPELLDLTAIEESMIARCRIKSWIVQLGEIGVTGTAKPDSQRAMRGHIISFPQRPDAAVSLLPPSIEDIVTPICVVFVGSTKPTREWLIQKAKPLCVRKEKVLNALNWLKTHNRLYRNVRINTAVLNELDKLRILPFRIEYVPTSASVEATTSRYDATDEPAHGDCEISFENVIISDVDATSSGSELKLAALRHFKTQGLAYLQIPHDPFPVNEFFNPDLFPLIYPTLYPYGLGGFEDRLRNPEMSMKKHVRNLCSRKDRRFCFSSFVLFLGLQHITKAGYASADKVNSAATAFPDCRADIFCY